MAWLWARWADVQPGTKVRRREYHQMGEVMIVRREPHRHGVTLRVELLLDDGRWYPLSTEQTNEVEVEVPDC